MLYTPLSDEEWEELDALLCADSQPEGSMDAVEAHGFLTALTICPEEVPREEWLEVLFDGPPSYADADQEARTLELLERLKGELEQQFSAGETPEIPCELELGDDPDESPLRAWCAAFIEGHFVREEAWFDAGEEEVGDLLLPVMVLSGLTDDADMERMARTPRLAQQFIDALPDNLDELYLLFRVPEEKSGGR